MPLLSDEKARYVLEKRLWYDVRRGYLSPGEASHLDDALGDGQSLALVQQQRKRLVRPRFWRGMLVRVVFGVLVIGGMMVIGQLHR